MRYKLNPGYKNAGGEYWMEYPHIVDSARQCRCVFFMGEVGGIANIDFIQHFPTRNELPNTNGGSMYDMLRMYEVFQL